MTPASDPTEWERRRARAARLFEEGRSQAEVARRLGVSRTTASRWAKRWDEEGIAGLSETRRPGRTPRLSDLELKAIERSLQLGPMAHGYRSDLWTLPRVTEVIRRQTGVHYHPGHVWRLLQKLGWSRRKPEAEAGRAAVGRWIKMNRLGETSEVRGAEAEDESDG